jgi:predicted nucleic acid-binding protein
MPSLVDTGMLLRYVHVRDPNYAVARAAVRALLLAGESLWITSQNVAEFWNVSTRPATARGGYGLTVAQTDARLCLIERSFAVLPDTSAIYAEWRRLVVSVGVSGVQVYDARLVAAMRVHGITRILTFNTADFARYPGITAIHPATV